MSAVGKTRAQSREYQSGCGLARRMLKSGESSAYIRRCAERIQRDVEQRDPLWHRAAGMLWVLDNDAERWVS